MKRRLVLRLSAAIVAELLLSAHTPYGQWVVYRKKHLLIGCHKADPVTYDLAKRVIARKDDMRASLHEGVARGPTP